MTLLLITGLVLLAAAVTLVVRGALAAAATHASTVQQIGAYGFSAAPIGGRRGRAAAACVRGLDELAGRLGEFIGSRARRAA